MKFLFAFLLMTSVSYAAEEVVVEDVLNSEIKAETRFADRKESRFVIDFKTNEVSGELNFYNVMQICSGSTINGMRDCSQVSRLVKQLSGKIEGLTLVDDKVIFYAQNGEVECGYVTTGRIFRNVKKLVLNGNCSLSTRVRSAHGIERFQFVFSVK